MCVFCTVSLCVCVCVPLRYLGHGGDVCEVEQDVLEGGQVRVGHLQPQRRGVHLSHLLYLKNTPRHVQRHTAG